MYSKFGQQQSLHLTSLKELPSHPVLIELLATANKNVGRPVYLSWTIPTSVAEYTLEACIPLPPKDLITRKTIEKEICDPSWTLTRRLDNQSVVVWSLVTGDMGLLLNLIWSEATGTNQETAETMDLTTTIRLGQTSRNKIPAASSKKKELAVEMPLIKAQEGEVEGDLPQNVTLAGDIAEIELSGVLQSISICKMTGRLDIQDKLNQAEIFFDDGALVHALFQTALATTDTLYGDQVLLDVLTWDSGTFFFHRARKTSEKTIKRRIEALLLEGAGLRDYKKFLQNNGVTEDSILYKQDESLSESDIEERISAGVPINIDAQKKFYACVNGENKLSQIIAQHSMNKPLWMPIVFNLLSCELVTLHSIAPKVTEEKDERVTFDQASVYQASRNLVRPESGMFTYPLFVHFLQNEFARYENARTTFSVVIFEISNGGEPLTNDALRQLVLCFDSFKAVYDIISHYSMLEAIMLLPHRNAEESRDLVKLFSERLMKETLDSVSDNSTLQMAFGIACVPDDQQDLAKLIGQAEQAEAAAKGGGMQHTTYRDLRWEELRVRGEQAIKAENYAEAETIWSQAFSEAQRLDHSDDHLIVSAERLAKVLNLRGKHAPSEPILALLLQLKTRTLGANHLSVAAAAGDLARCYYLQGNYKDAEPLLKRIVEICEQSHGVEDTSVATALYNLATLYHFQKKYGEAEKAYKRALDIRHETLGREHPDTIKIANSYDNLLKSLKGEKSPDSPATVSADSWRQIDPEEKPLSSKASSNKSVGKSENLRTK